MHDELFSDQRHLEPADLRRRAEGLGLDLARFDADVLDLAVAARIERDVESGERSGVDGTPSLFIDGIRYSGPRDRASLLGALRRGIASPRPSEADRRRPSNRREETP
jgi:predicted DsbA family dithiol-disulfide isomerase